MASDEISKVLGSIYADSLMDRHREAMACRDLESFLGVGVLLYRQLSSQHKEWFAKVESKAIPYSADDAQLLADKFQEWKKATEFWIQAIDRFENNGYEVEYAARIRGFYSEIAVCNLEPSRLSAAYQEAEETGGISEDELFLSLQHSANS